MSERRKTIRRTSDWLAYAMIAAMVVQSTVLGLALGFNAFVLWKYYSFINGMAEVAENMPQSF